MNDRPRLKFPVRGFVDNINTLNEVREELKQVGYVNFSFCLTFSRRVLYGNTYSTYSVRNDSLEYLYINSVCAISYIVRPNCWQTDRVVLGLQERLLSIVNQTNRCNGRTRSTCICIIAFGKTDRQHIFIHVIS